MGGEVVRLLSDHTQLGIAYRVDMRLRPEGDQGVLVRSFDATMGYYETRGRTWERQALIKCRPIAGDLDLGRDFIEAITPFIYRRYLSASEIAEIKALKRRIEQRTASAGRAEVEVKTGRGGIRDVEFVVQFLQLLHGGEYPEVRAPTRSTALDRLEQVGCLTAEERAVMDGTYRFLRQVEHRLQILFDRQTHEMPRDIEDLRTLAIRMGYAPRPRADDERAGPAHRFLADYQAKTDAEPANPRSHPPRRVPRRRRRRAPTRWSTWCSTPIPSDELIAASARPPTRSATRTAPIRTSMALCA